MPRCLASSSARPYIECFFDIRITLKRLKNVGHCPTVLSGGCWPDTVFRLMIGREFRDDRGAIVTLPPLLD